jgi:hypothetical protein
VKRIYGNLATVAALLLISILAASAQSSVPATDSMTAGQARRAIIESSTYMRVWANQSGGRVSIATASGLPPTPLSTT